MAKRMIVLFHGEDVDGNLAAVVIRAAFPRSEIDFRLIGNGEWKNYLFNFFTNLKVQKYCNTDLYILDLTAFDEFFEIDRLYGGRVNFHLIDGLIQNFRKVVWYDHHAATYRNRDKLVGCGAELTLGYLEKKCTTSLLTPNTSFLGDVAQISDYPESVNIGHECGIYATDLQKVITVSRSLLMDDKVAFLDFFITLINDLVKYKDIFNEKCFRHALYSGRVKYFNQISVKLNDDLDKSLNVVESLLCSKKFLIGYADSMLPQKETVRRLREEYSEYGYSAVLVVFGHRTNNALCLSTLEDDFNVESFCEFMGGGGRDGNGGGFGIRENTERDDFPKILKNIEEGINEFLKENFIGVNVK